MSWASPPKVSPAALRHRRPEKSPTHIGAPNDRATTQTSSHAKPAAVARDSARNLSEGTASKNGEGEAGVDPASDDRGETLRTNAGATARSIAKAGGRKPMLLVVLVVVALGTTFQAKTSILLTKVQGTPFWMRAALVCSQPQHENSLACMLTGGAQIKPL